MSLRVFREGRELPAAMCKSGSRDKGQGVRVSPTFAGESTISRRGFRARVADKPLTWELLAPPGTSQADGPDIGTHPFYCDGILGFACAGAGYA